MNTFSSRDEKISQILDSLCSKCVDNIKGMVEIGCKCSQRECVEGRIKNIIDALLEDCYSCNNCIFSSINYSQERCDTCEVRAHWAQLPHHKIEPSIKPKTCGDDRKE